MSDKQSYHHHKCGGIHPDGECPQEKPESSLAPEHGSAENLCLPNDTKVRFCNAFDQIKAHTILCKECDMYLRWGYGDLCSAGKTIIARELCFADTSIEVPPNAERSDLREKI